MKSRGSAILIAIFLVAAVGSVAFSIGRLFTLGTRLATQYEDSTVAYYAAESGIEEGYLRYRYNKNIEIAPNFESDMLVQRTMVSNLTTSANVDYGSEPGSNAATYYDLSMKYLVPFYGKDVDAFPSVTASDISNAKYPKEYFVPRDEAIKIDISGLVNQLRDVNLLMQFKSDDGAGMCPVGTKPFVEIKATGKTPDSMPTTLTEQKAALYNSLAARKPTTSFRDADSIAQDSITPGSDPNGVLEYKNLLAVLRNRTASGIFNTANNHVELMFKPVGCSVRIGMVDANPAGGPVRNNFAAPFSTIHSIGRYGGITRTLEAKIDRQAGTLYDLFDFVLFQR